MCLSYLHDHYEWPLVSKLWWNNHIVFPLCFSFHCIVYTIHMYLSYLYVFQSKWSQWVSVCIKIMIKLHHHSTFPLCSIVYHTHVPIIHVPMCSNLHDDYSGCLCQNSDEAIMLLFPLCCSFHCIFYTIHMYLCVPIYMITMSGCSCLNYEETITLLFPLCCSFLFQSTWWLWVAVCVWIAMKPSHVTLLFPLLCFFHYVAFSCVFFLLFPLR